VDDGAHVAIGDLVTHARTQREAASVGEFGLQFTLEAQQEVALEHQ
jgi:hypothetical protein